MKLRAPISDTGTAISRNQRHAQTAQEQKDDDDHQPESLDQGLDDLLDTGSDEGDRAVGDLPVHSLRECALDPAKRRPHGLGCPQGIGAGSEIDTDHRGGLAVETGNGVLALGTQFDPGHIAEQNERSVGHGANDDLLELVDTAEAALGLDAELELRIVGHRLRSDAANRGLHVLRVDSGNDVVHRNAETGHPVDVQPDPHGIILRSKDDGIAHPFRTLDAVEHVDRGEIRQEQRILGGIVGRNRDHHQQRGRFLLRADAGARYLFGQRRHRQGDPVLHVDSVDIRIGAWGEGHLQGVAPVRSAGRLHVEHVADTDDLLLDRLGNRGFHDLGAGARVKRRHLNLRRHDIRQLLDWKLGQRNQTGHRDDNRDDQRKAGAADKDPGKHRAYSDFAAEPPVAC